MKKLAKVNLDDGTSRIKRWWSKKYNRPPNDPLFQNRSIAEHIAEMYEDLLSRRDELYEELKANPIDSAGVMKHIDQINRILGEESEEEDPLVAEWEAALERGEEPDI